MGNQGRKMKSTQRPDKRIHIRKKVAGGTTGAVLGAVVGGPVGALVGGVVGTLVGGAAESGKLQQLTSTNDTGNRKPVAKAKAAVKDVARKTRPAAKVTTENKARAARPKRASKKRS